MPVIPGRKSSTQMTRKLEMKIKKDKTSEDKDSKEEDDEDDDRNHRP